MSETGVSPSAPGGAGALMMAARKECTLKKEEMHIRGYVMDEAKGKAVGGEYTVQAEIRPHLGIRYGLTRRMDGLKGWSVWEWTTGLLVCHAQTKAEALEKIDQLHRACARCVQTIFNTGNFGIFHDWANEMTTEEYAALEGGTYGNG